MLENQIPKPMLPKPKAPSKETLELQSEIRDLAVHLEMERVNNPTTKDQLISSVKSRGHEGLRPTHVAIDEVQNMPRVKKPPRFDPSKHLTDTPLANHPGLLNLKSELTPEQQDEVTRVTKSIGVKDEHQS